MAERKLGKVVCWQNLSSVLSIFRIMPQDGSRFPDYKPGQYIALRREQCKLTKKIGNVNGHPVYGPDFDESGIQKIGPVTHSYSISSSPMETLEHQWLEFYVILEKDEEGHPGRLTESIFNVDLHNDNQLTYVDRITGDFTLDKRAAGYKNVLLVGTGTGLAPFASMIKQLDAEAREGKSNPASYTLLHTNRTYEELGYHQELLNIEAAGRFDFLYVPSVSRPSQRDFENKRLGKGRANNLLRMILEMPTREDQDVREAIEKGIDPSAPQQVLARTVQPVLPEHVTLKQLHERLDPPQTVILTCGNPSSMADIKFAADANQIPFEKEDW